MFNKQGRHVSESMRLNSFKKFLKHQAIDNTPQRIEYKGFVITRPGNEHWFIDGWRNNAMHISLIKAKAVIDRCLEIRAEMSI